jgi:hypothetical protein
MVWAHDKCLDQRLAPTSIIIKWQGSGCDGWTVHGPAGGPGAQTAQTQRLPFKLILIPLSGSTRTTFMLMFDAKTPCVQKGGV